MANPLEVLLQLERPYNQFVRVDGENLVWEFAVRHTVHYSAFSGILFAYGASELFEFGIYVKLDKLQEALDVVYERSTRRKVKVKAWFRKLLYG